MRETEILGEGLGFLGLDGLFARRHDASDGLETELIRFLRGCEMFVGRDLRCFSRSIDASRRAMPHWA